MRGEGSNGTISAVSDGDFRSLFEGTEVGMLFTGLDGRIRPNPAYCRLLGFTEEQLFDSTYEDIIHPDDRAETRRRFATILGGPKHHARWRTRYVRRDGTTIWVDVSTGLAVDEAGSPSGYHTVVIDISQRVAAEVAAADANELLEDRVSRRTAQLEASNGDLEAFSYSVSHDLRAPLRAISGFSRMLEKKYGSTLDETAGGYVRRIVQGADRMGEMIDDLLRFARLGRQQLNRLMIDPAVLAREALEDLQGEMDDRSVTVVIEEMPPMWADRALIHHVYVNLLSNALKFTSGCTQAAISARSQTRDDGIVVYSVSDNGAGFDMNYVHKLFGVFERLHPREEYEGTGVGLALVKAIIERHNGAVWAEGEVGAGATFSFTIGGPV